MDDPRPVGIGALNLDLFGAAADPAGLVYAWPSWRDRPIQLPSAQHCFLPIRPANEVETLGLLPQDQGLPAPLGLRPATEGVGLANLDTAAWHERMFASLSNVPRLGHLS